MKARISIVFLCLLMITLFGCSNSKYQTAFNSFKDSYIDATQFLDDQYNSDVDTVNGADSKKLEQVTQDMVGLIKTMEECARTKIEKFHLSEVQEDYDALTYILKYKNSTDKEFLGDFTQLSIAIVTLNVDRNNYLGRKD